MFYNHRTFFWQEYNGQTDKFKYRERMSGEERVCKYLEYKNNIVKFAEECINVAQPYGITKLRLNNIHKKILRSFLMPIGTTTQV